MTDTTTELYLENYLKSLFGIIDAVVELAQIHPEGKQQLRQMILSSFERDYVRRFSSGLTDDEKEKLLYIAGNEADEQRRIDLIFKFLLGIYDQVTLIEGMIKDVEKIADQLIVCVNESFSDKVKQQFNTQVNLLLTPYTSPTFS